MATGERFLFYSSIMDTTERIKSAYGKEDAYNFLEDVIYYGLYGEEPDDDSKSWLYGFDTIAAVIKSAQDNYDKKAEMGKRGGRPKTIPEGDIPQIQNVLNAAQGKVDRTNAKKRLANQYGCSVRTLERALKMYEQESMMRSEVERQNQFCPATKPILSENENCDKIDKTTTKPILSHSDKTDKTDKSTTKLVLSVETPPASATKLTKARQNLIYNKNKNNNKNTDFFAEGEKISTEDNWDAAAWEF